MVGHSWSGALALNLALDHPDLVSGLVLLAPVSHPWPGDGISWYYRPATWPVLRRLLTWTLTTPAGLLLMKPTLGVVFAPQDPPAAYIERSRIPLVLRPRAFRANAEDVSGLYRFVVRQSRRYGAIRAPTAIVSGDADTIVWTNLHSRSLEREIPGARLVVLPGVGHMPHHAAPDIVAREIEAVAARHRRTTAQPQPPWHLSNGAMDKVELRRLTLLVFQLFRLLVRPRGQNGKRDWERWPRHRCRHSA